MVSTGEDPTDLAAELDKAEVRIAELKSVVVKTVRRHEELLDKSKQLHAVWISVWKEAPVENANRRLTM